MTTPATDDMFAVIPKSFAIWAAELRLLNPHSEWASQIYDACWGGDE